MTALSLTRRDFIAGSSAIAALLMSGRVVGQKTDPADLTIEEAAGHIRSGSISPVELTRAYLERIERFDPQVNAFITVTDRQALARARELEAELSKGMWRGPLHGIPIALKDNIDTAGILTTAASALFANRIPDEDAEVVRRLKQAGAVILGKLNMHEFAFGGTSAVTHYGPVHNPWHLDHIPGGSSGGSGAAVAARLCAGALGTDTAASIRMPASFCGIVGLKATHGLASIRGIFPISEALDHVGPMCRSVADSALMLQALAGYDPEGVTSIDVPIPAYSGGLNLPTSKFRLGIPRKFFYEKLDREVETAINQALDLLSDMTAATHEVELPPTPSFFALIAEAYLFHAEYLENQQNHSLYQKPTLQRIMAGAKISRMEYQQAIRQLTLARKAIDAVFSDVDLLITPTSPVLPRTIRNAEEQSGQAVPEMSARNTLPFNFYGIPTITVPCGFSRKGLPIGLQISGPRLGELKVLALAHAYEQVTDWHTRRPPIS